MCCTNTRAVVLSLSPLVLAKTADRSTTCASSVVDFVRWGGLSADGVWRILPLSVAAADDNTNVRTKNTKTPTPAATIEVPGYSSSRTPFRFTERSSAAEEELYPGIYILRVANSIPLYAWVC